MNDFIAKVRYIYNLSDDSLETLLNGFDEISCKKGTLLLQEGNVNKNIYFLKSGFSRAYINRDGKELTLWFVSSGDAAATYSDQYTTTNVELLEDSILLKMSRPKMESLLLNNLELANWSRLLSEFYLNKYAHYFTHYQWLEAKDKYELLIKEFPEILQKAPIKDIASYLNIAPQSLSRIRGSYNNGIK